MQRGGDGEVGREGEAEGGGCCNGKESKQSSDKDAAELHVLKDKDVGLCSQVSKLAVCMRSLRRSNARCTFGATTQAIAKGPTHSIYKQANKPVVLKREWRKFDRRVRTQIRALTFPPPTVSY